MPPAIGSVLPRRLLLTVGLGALVGCSPELPDPVVTGVRPGWGFNGQDTRIEVVGHSFYPRVQLGSGDEAVFDHQFRVILEADPEVELGDVSSVDYRTLEAVVPAGVAVGRYGLRVEGPTGATGRLDEAFDVRDSLADHLLLTPTDGQLSWTVGEFASFDVELVDIDGGRVTEDIEVSIRAEGVDGSSLSFQSDVLEDQVSLADGTGILGRLGASGQARVSFTSSESISAMVLRVDAAEADSAVEGSLQILSFTPGEVAGLRIVLPEGVTQATAGSSFPIDIYAVDEAGNEVVGADTQLLLYEACEGGTLAQTVHFAGSIREQSVRLTRATQDDCVTNGIVAVGISGGAAVSATSDAVAVLPGSAIGLDLKALPRSVIAGVEPLYVFATAVDAWANRVEDSTGPLSIAASTDGGAFVAPAWWECGELVGGEAVCQCLLTEAGESVVLWASTAGPSTLTGFSAPFVVEPGEVTSLEAVVEGDPIEAGQPFELRVEAKDSLGNGVWLDTEGDDLIEASTDLGDLVCVWDRHADDGPAEILSCLLTVAGDARVIDVELGSRGVSGTSEPFDVHNGDLALVEVELGADSVVVGEGLGIVVSAFDAWGNAWIERSVSTIDLADLGGSLIPASVSLDSEGEANVVGIMTQAMVDNRIEASVGGVVFGTSAPFDLLPGSATQVDVSAEQPFAWVDEPLSLSVRVVDAYGNTATSYSGAAFLRTTTGSEADVSVELVGGQADTTFTWTEGRLDESLAVSAGDFDAVLSLDVLWSDCSDGPTASLSVDGTDSAVLCRLSSSGRTRTVTVSSAASSSGGAGSLVRRLYREGGGSWEEGGSSYLTSWDEVAGFGVDLVVADAAACGSQARALVYVGDPDGQPTGPVDISSDVSELRAGDSGTSGTANVEVSAWDCEGDPASGGELLVRVDRGGIVVDGAVVSTTGKGLIVTLDSAGSASFAWSSASTSHGGEGRAHVGREQASAYGALSMTFTNDAVRPRVVSMDPVGSLSGSVDSFELRFSEALLPASLSSSLIRLSGPSGDAVSLDADDVLLDGDTLWIVPPDALDMDAGAWQLTVDSAVRDLEGNRLDGTWSGVRSSFTRQFGDVSNDAPDLDGCELERATFRPDGDDGTGDEAEQAFIQVLADGPADWWRMTVTDESLAEVLVQWVPATSATSVDLEWDGSDGTGRTVDEGTYRVSVTGADSVWNEGASCEIEVSVVHRLQAP